MSRRRIVILNHKSVQFFILVDLYLLIVAMYGFYVETYYDLFCVDLHSGLQRLGTFDPVDLPMTLPPTKGYD